MPYFLPNINNHIENLFLSSGIEALDFADGEGSFEFQWYAT